MPGTRLSAHYVVDAERATDGPFLLGETENRGIFSRSNRDGIIPVEYIVKIVDRRDNSQVYTIEEPSTMVPVGTMNGYVGSHGDVTRQHINSIITHVRRQNTVCRKR